MWRRLSYLSPILLIFATIAVNFVQPHVVFADSQQEEAAKFCGLVSSTYATSVPKDQQLSLCEQGFTAGLDKNAPAPPISDSAKQKCASSPPGQPNGATCRVYLTQQGVCYSKLYPKDGNSAFYCQIGYNLGYYNSATVRNLPPTPSNPQQQQQQDQADQACSPIIPGAANSNELLQACEAGYIGALNGQSETQACVDNSGTPIDKQYCDQGFQLGTPTSSTGSNLGCESNDNPLAWIICPIVVNVLVPAVGWIDGLITNQLTIKTNVIFCDNSDTCQAYYQAWQSFRDIALGLMAIAGLVIIIAQALGLEILDTYTIRKVLPRLLIAAIGITLSWPLMRFLINLSNDLGFGIRHLIYAPFANLNSSLDLSFGGSAANIFFGGLGLAAAPGAVYAGLIAAGGLGAILSLATTAALAVFVAILVLILRQVAIIMLMLLAPVAIVAYILPNTQRIYRLWWESFSRALLMFPLIAAFIATGRVFSAVAINNGTVLNQLIGFVAYFAPYFMIPLTFRMSGAAIGALGNFVQSRAQGGFSTLRNARAEAGKKSRAEFAHKAKTGEFKAINKIPGSAKLARASNRIGLGVGAGWKGRYGFGARGATATGNIAQNAIYEMQKTPEMQAIAGKNDFNRVLAEGAGSQERGRQGLIRHLMNGGDDGEFVNRYTAQFGEEEGRRRAQTAAERQADFAVKSVKSIGFSAATGGAALLNMAADGTALRDVDDEMRLAALVSEGNPNNAFTLASRAGSFSRQAGRPGLAPASAETGALVFSHVDEMYHNGAPVNYTGGRLRDQLITDATLSGIGGEIAYSLLGSGKSRDIKNYVKNSLDIVRKHQTALNNGQPSEFSQEEVERAALNLVDMRNNMAAGIGKADNRRAAQASFDDDRDGVKDLEAFLKAPSLISNPDTKETELRGTRVAPDEVPAVGPVDKYGRAPTAIVPKTVPVTNEEHINTLVTQRYSSLPQSEIERLNAPPPPPEEG